MDNHNIPNQGSIRGTISNQTIKLPEPALCILLSKTEQNFYGHVNSALAFLYHYNGSQKY